MNDFIEEREVNEARLKTGRIANLIRVIDNATHRGEQITITFSPGVGYKEPVIDWETVEIDK